jgi:hypothetical protein
MGRILFAGRCPALLIIGLSALNLTTVAPSLRRTEFIFFIFFISFHRDKSQSCSEDIQSSSLSLF